MLELVQLSKNCYQINNPSKIGLFTCNDFTYLVDSGNDKETGRKIRQILDEKNFNLKGILNTHAHADHIGGNAYLQNNKGCMVFAPTIESALISNTTIGPSIIYGGRVPKSSLTKILYSEPTPHVSNFDNDAFPENVSVIPLKGHSPNMVGYLIDDGICYIGDSITSASTLDKYQITYIYNIKDYLDSLDVLDNLDAKLFVPSHAENVEDIKELTTLNRNKVLEIADYLTNIVKDGLSYDNILDRVFVDYFIPSNQNQILLIGSTIKNYLTYLIDENKITISTNKSKLIFTKI